MPPRGRGPPDPHPPAGCSSRRRMSRTRTISRGATPWDALRVWRIPGRTASRGLGTLRGEGPGVGDATAVRPLRRVPRATLLRPHRRVADWWPGATRTIRHGLTRPATTSVPQALGHEWLEASSALRGDVAARVRATRPATSGPRRATAAWSTEWTWRRWPMPANASTRGAPPERLIRSEKRTPAGTNPAGVQTDRWPALWRVPPVPQAS